MIAVKHRAGLTAWVVLGVIAAISPVLADETVLATSKTRKLQVLAEGGAAWCKPTVRLRMVLDHDSPDVRNPASQVEVMNRLKMPITTDCKVARAAELSVFEQGQLVGAYEASADKDWVFAAVPPVSAPAAALKGEPPPSSAPSPLPRDTNYASAVIRLIKDNPALAQNDDVLRCWAGYRFREEYWQFRDQEFKLQPLLQKARADLAETMAQNDGRRVTALIVASFGSYNFDAEQFPIALGQKSLEFVRNYKRGSKIPYFSCWAPTLPDRLTIEVPNLNVITGMPMERKLAQAFLDKRTRYSSVDRSIAIAVTIRLDDGGFVENGWGAMSATGILESAVFYANKDETRPLSWLMPEEMEKMRAARAAEQAALAKAEQEREAENRRRQMLAQREQTIQALSSASASVRMANWISDGEIDYRAALDDLRSARGAALIGGKPVMVSMLIQTDASGRTKVGARWPGKLEVTLAEGLADLSASGWYLVHGLLSVPDGDSLPPAQLAARAAYACVQPQCADAAVPAAVVDRKLAGLAGAK